MALRLTKKEQALVLKWRSLEKNNLFEPDHAVTEIPKFFSSLICGWGDEIPITDLADGSWYLRMMHEMCTAYERA